jgi:hypothetical protein
VERLNLTLRQEALNHFIYVGHMPQYNRLVRLDIASE